MRLALFGADGKVGRALAPVLESAGHEVRGIELGEPAEVAGLAAAIDFTTPDAAPQNVRAALEQGVRRRRYDGLGSGAARSARRRTGGCVSSVAPNFSIGAVLMMRFAREAAAFLPRAEIVELHNEAKRDVPPGTAPRDRRADRPGHGDPLRSAARPRRAPGGDLRR